MTDDPAVRTEVLRSLLSTVCAPILSAAGAQLTPAQVSAVAWAPLVIVSSDPPHAVLMGFDHEAGESVFCGGYDLPDPGGHALARFFELALSALSTNAMRKVMTIVAAGEAQLMASIRADLGRADCLLSARESRFQPVKLFSLTGDWPAETRH